MRFRRRNYRQDAALWRERYEELWYAYENLRLWEPGRKGWAAAQREFERVWLRRVGGDE